MTPVKSFGGFGGVWNTVPWADWSADEFAQALMRSCGARIRASDADASAAWGALANVDWTHFVGAIVDAEASYSFRAAGDLIASIRGSGIYVDWYCTAPAATVPDWIRDAMASEGWTPEEPKP